jgi:hypothetical protein
VKEENYWTRSGNLSFPAPDFGSNVVSIRKRDVVVAFFDPLVYGAQFVDESLLI